MRNTEASQCYRAAVTQRRSKRLFRSLKGAAPAKSLNEPVSLMFRADCIKAPQATRASAAPTEIRRTPRALSWETEESQLLVETRTFTGLGATALTIAAIS